MELAASPQSRKRPSRSLWQAGPRTAACEPRAALGLRSSATQRGLRGAPSQPGCPMVPQLSRNRGFRAFTLPHTLQELGAGAQHEGPPSPGRGAGVGGRGARGGREAGTGTPGLAELQGTVCQGSSCPAPANGERLSLKPLGLC